MASGAPNFNAENWRLEMAKALRCADEIFVPSRDVLNRVRKYFKRQRGIRVIEHGVPVHSKGADPAAASPAGEKLSLCFLGYTHAAHKGGLLLDRIVPGLLARNIEVHFLGSDASRWKQCLWAKGVRFHGAYRRNEVVQKIRGINPSLIAIPSLAPETYSYTLSEAWMAGVPVVVPPIGALEERVRVSGGGIVLHDFKPETFLETVSRLAVNGVLYRGLQEAVSKIHLKTTRENAAEYRAIYESRLVPRSRAEGVTDESIFRFKSDGQKNYWRKIGPDAQKKKWSPGRMLLGWRWAMVPRVRAAAARLLWRPGTPEEVNGKVFDADRAIFACIKD